MYLPQAVASEPAEELLAESGITRVVRVGGTFRRPVRPFTATVQSFLQHLWDQGIRCIPEPLGYDDQGREILGYVEEDVPVEPLPFWATAKPVLIGLAPLIRRLHGVSAVLAMASRRSYDSSTARFWSYGATEKWLANRAAPSAKRTAPKTTTQSPKRVPATPP